MMTVKQPLLRNTAQEVLDRYNACPTPGAFLDEFHQIETSPLWLTFDLVEQEVMKQFADSTYAACIICGLPTTAKP